MTAPIIQAGEWPEDAAMHSWDRANGHGYWTVYDKYDGIWTVRASHIPMPTGWDWRAPVLRPTVEDSLTVAPAIDLEKLRMLAQGSIDALTQSRVFLADVSAAIGSMRQILALIDGQASVRSSSEHSSEVAADLVTDDAVRRMVRAMENTPGDELIEPNAQLCRRLLAAALQPTKGEGVADD